MVGVYSALMTDSPLRFKDFTLSQEPITFKIGPDTFTAPSVLPPVVIGCLVDAARGVGAEDADFDTKIKKIAEVFQLLLTPDSGDRFAQRLLSRDEPIDLNQQAVPIMYWLLEVYGLRPTQPSSPSLIGSGGDGTNLTDGV